MMGIEERVGTRTTYLFRYVLYTVALETLKPELGNEQATNVTGDLTSACERTLAWTTEATLLPKLVEPVPMMASSLIQAPNSPLVGRQQSLLQACSLLLDGAAPLVTLVGPGGVGKTRLAVAIMHDLGDAFADGSVFVDLSPLADPCLVADAVANALNLDADSLQPFLLRICNHLRARQMLVVLDN